MQIDCYGFEASSQWFKRRTLDPYLIKRVSADRRSLCGAKSLEQCEGITYLCFGNQPMRPIHRIDRDPDGNLRLMWAFGAFADAGEWL